MIRVAEFWARPWQRRGLIAWVATAEGKAAPAQKEAASLDAIHQALTALVALPESRLRALPPAEVELNEDGLVQMSLNVTIAD